MRIDYFCPEGLAPSEELRSMPGPRMHAFPCHLQWSCSPCARSGRGSGLGSGLGDGGLRLGLRLGRRLGLCLGRAAHGVGLAPVADAVVAGWQGVLIVQISHLLNRRASVFMERRIAN